MLLTVNERNEVLGNLDSPFRCCARCRREVIGVTHHSVYIFSKLICVYCALVEKVDGFDWTKDVEVGEDA